MDGRINNSLNEDLSGDFEIIEHFEIPKPQVASKRGERKEIRKSRRKRRENKIYDSFIGHSNEPTTYIETRKYGGTGFDDSDPDSEDESDPLFVSATPSTKQRMHEEKIK